ncbi:MAG: carbohydrate binding family 9 domain-containing protein [Candidatus Aminicenantes bacterium]|nr:MAG: carbohydrate binding family 9 domain-containing protein [Candidatus Aminicenantes bacterium]
MRDDFPAIKIMLVVFILIAASIHHYMWPESREAQDYVISETRSKVKVDGVLNDEAWENAVKIDLSYEVYPGENIPAPVKTECLLTYSKTALYIAFRCFEPEPKKIRAHLMDRDSGFTLLQDDHVTIFMDTFNDERRCYEFRINPLGVQADGIYSEVEDYEDLSWDAIWKSAGKITDWGYTVEITIPFNQLRFPRSKKEQTWGLSFERSYPRNVRRKFSSHPWDRNVSCSLCQFNKVTGFKNMVPGRNFQVAPTLTVSRTDTRENVPFGDMNAGKTKIEPGISGHWGIASNLILNAAVNPEFSHVEADAAQLEVNIRFALRYPEKRPFFLEGVDYFLTPLEAVFTRTVFDPLWGIKLTGKMGKNYLGFFLNQDRYNNLLFPANQGSMSASQKENVLGGVFRYRRDVGKGSILGFLYTGRESTDGDYYNHTAGIDGLLRLSKTKTITFQYLRTQSRYPAGIAADYGQPEGSFGGNGLFFNFAHAGRNLGYGVGYKDLAADFRADYGFIPRVDIRMYSAYFQPNLWGKPGGWFDSIFFNMTGEYVTDHEGNLTDRKLQIGVTYQGPLQSFVEPVFMNQKERYNGVIYDLNRFQAYLEMKPAGGMKYFLYSQIGDSIDYVNARPARSVLLNPGVELGIGRHLNIQLDHIFERLSFEGNKIYTVHLFQARMVYNFNVKTFFRTIIQYMDINRNTHQYIVPTEPLTRTLFTQFLFSYKINPQTVLFLGYSDNHFGMRGIDLTRIDRTFFLKIGYALVL